MNRFQTLMHRYFQGQASDEEIAEFKRLISTSEENEAALRARIDEEVTKALEKIQEKSLRTLDDASDTDRVLEKIRAHYRHRHGLDQHDAKVGERSKAWRQLAVAATISILVAGFLYWFAANMNSGLTNTEQIAKVFTGPDWIELPDGSSVELNAGSELYYTDKFGESSRQIYLKGEAFFDVTHNPASPFIVNTGTVTTKVLGTAFNVRAYPGEKVKVTVSRGLVEVAGEKRIFGQIKPNQQIAVDSKTDDFVAQEVNTLKETEWRDQYFILKNTSMSRVGQMISERFHVSVTIANNDLRDCRVTTKFLNGEGLEPVLAILSEMTKATYKIQDNKVFIEGGRCR